MEKISIGGLQNQVKFPTDWSFESGKISTFVNPLHWENALEYIFVTLDGIEILLN